MTIENTLDVLDSFFNSAFGFMLAMAATFALIFWILGKINPFDEKWRQWEGSIITGIKLAEKQIPDDTPNAGLERLDAALRFVLKAYGEANRGKQPSPKVIEQIKQGIQTKHADLARFGGLEKPKSRK